MIQCNTPTLLVILMLLVLLPCFGIGLGIMTRKPHKDLKGWEQYRKKNQTKQQKKFEKEHPEKELRPFVDNPSTDRDQ